MKKIALLFARLFAFSLSSLASSTVISEDGEIASVIKEHYPGLKGYYEAGLLKVEELSSLERFSEMTQHNSFLSVLVESSSALLRL